MITRLVTSKFTQSVKAVKTFGPRKSLEGRCLGLSNWTACALIRSFGLQTPLQQSLQKRVLRGGFSTRFSSLNGRRALIRRFSVKSTPTEAETVKEGVEAEKEAEEVIEKNEAQTAKEVDDSGPGLSEEELRALSDKFKLVPEGCQIPVGIWLLAVAGSVALMIMVGGYTRLSKSGLSMVSWKPLGHHFPQNDEEWVEEFDNYKKFPEYRLRSEDITLERFKFIFFVEYAHRMLGRSIGVLFGLPFAYFWARGYFKTRLKLRLGGLFVLGGLQGLIGWWMVRSGLQPKPQYQTKPRVSVYRLFVHLNMAMVIYSVSLWHGLVLLRKPVELTWTAQNFRRMRVLRIGSVSMLGLIALNISSGSIVAGLDAGKVFNTWPLMNGAVIPGGYWQDEKGINNFFENMANVQFNHRTLAYITYIFSTGLFWTNFFQPSIPTHVKAGLFLTYALVNYQLANGINMVLDGVPLRLGLEHQTNAVVTLTSFLIFAAMCRRPSKSVFKALKNASKKYKK